MARAHELDLPVHVWTVNEPDLPVHVRTVNEPDAMASLLDLGVDGLMTDQPERLRDVLRARAWSPGPTG